VLELASVPGATGEPGRPGRLRSRSGSSATAGISAHPTRWEQLHLVSVAVGFRIASKLAGATATAASTAARIVYGSGLSDLG